VTRPGRQRGIALITAVFIVVLASIAATAMLSAAAVAIRRTANLQDSETAWWYAEGLETWVAGLLQRRPGAPEVDGLGDPWAQPVTDLPFGRGSIRGQMVDLQGRFNLNNLAATGTDSQFYRRQFRLLLANLPGVDLTGLPDLGAAVQQWITAPGQGTSSGDGGASYYLSLDVPYRPSQQLMTRPSELLAVRGVTPQVYRALKPYIAALPQIGTKVNLNTAPLPVLLSLAPDVDASKLQDFVKSRVKTPLPKVESAYQTQLNLLPADVSNVHVSVATQYFELHAQIQVDDDRLSLYSDIVRPQGALPHVYLRTTGAD